MSESGAVPKDLRRSHSSEPAFTRANQFRSVK